MASTGRAQNDYWHQYARAEFATLRSEIDRRSNTQQAVLVLFTTGVGAIVTVAFQNRASFASLLVIPFFSFAAASLIKDNAIKIGQIGRYLDELARRSGYDSVGRPNWERYTRENRSGRRRILVGWSTGPFVILGVSSAAAVFAALVDVTNWPASAPTGAGQPASLGFSNISPLMIWVIWSVAAALSVLTFVVLLFGKKREKGSIKRRLKAAGQRVGSSVRGPGRPGSVQPHAVVTDETGPQDASDTPQEQHPVDT